MHDENASLYLEWNLRTRCPPRARARAKASAPLEKGSYPMGDSVGLSFQGAIRRLPADLGARFTEAARAVVEIAPQRIARAFLNAAAAPGATPDYFTDGVRVVSSRGFASLARSLQDLVIEIWRRLASSAALRAILIATIDDQLLDRLSAQDGSQWLRYLGGPENGPYNEPGRAGLLGAYWSERARDLRAVLAAIHAKPSSASSRLEEYFYDPIRPLHILRQGRRAPTIIVFGELEALRGLSYTHALAHGRAGTIDVSIKSPDPRAACSWRELTPNKGAPFLRRSALLTRLEELELINWIENNHVISEHGGYRPQELPFGVFSGCRQLGARVESMANRLASTRGGAGFSSAIVPGAERREQPRAFARNRGLKCTAEAT